MNPIRAGIADKPDNARYTSAYERMQDRMSSDPQHPNSGWLSAVHVDGDGYDGVAAKRRASNKGYMELAFVEYLELLDSLIRRERIEKAGGTLVDYPQMLERLGVSATDWEKSVRLTSRRFSRELEISAKMFAEARRRG